MDSTNQDLLATQSLLMTFEKAKSSVDNLLDFNISGLLAITNGSGSIFRANLELSKLFGTDCEGVIGQSFYKILNDDAKSKIECSLFDDPQNKNQSIEASVLVNGNPRLFQFSSKKIESNISDGPNYFVILGNDITEVVNLTKENTQLIQSNTTLLNSKESLDLMLNSLNQGILLIDSKGVCSQQFSTACIEIFNTSPGGKRIVDVLNFDQSEKDLFQEWLSFIFHNASVSKKLVGMAPKRLRNDQNKEVVLDFRPLYAGEELPSHLLLIATDKTAEVEALNKIKKSEMYSQMILKMVKQKDDFIIGIATIQTLLDEIVTSRQYSNLPNVSVSDLRYNIHSIKGTSGFLSMNDLQEACHEFENKLDARNESEVFQPWNNLYLDQVQTAFKRNLEEARNILGFKDNPNNLKTREFSFSKIKSLFSEYKRLFGASSDFVIQFYSDVVCQSAQELFLTFENHTSYLAKKVGVKVNPLKIADNGIRLNPFFFEKFLVELNHIFRNIVDHGIEKEDVRKELGKPAEGTVTISLTKERLKIGENLKLSIKDDGAGIRLDKLRKKLSELSSPMKDGSDEEVLNSIFLEGVSTAENLTKISGRGVGMPAVRSEIVNLGGTIEVKSELGKGTEFIITFSYMGNVPTEKGWI